MKPTLKIVLIGLFSGLLVVLQVALAPLPNIELVTFLMLMYTLFLPFSMSILIVLVFVTLEMLTWGMGDWVIGYYWIWLVWIGLVYTLKPILKQNHFSWALLSGFWGILFGMLFAINHGFFYGFKFSLIYWIKGISFDIIHTISNYIIVLVLFKPTYILLTKLLERNGDPHENHN